ncbi:hypothetical protein ACFQ3N_06965 [Virgibacillus byunsanensis]|uniref:Uncharacterized protein n=1 Tax=Virgibacillus byunsanensis TaxID=570945 RepID=A0ABW3LID0_9BACI
MEALRHKLVLVFGIVTVGIWVAVITLLLLQDNTVVIDSHSMSQKNTTEKQSVVIFNKGTADTDNTSTDDVPINLGHLVSEDKDTISIDILLAALNTNE